MKKSRFLYLHPQANAVVQRYLVAVDLNRAPITLPYLKKLLAHVEAANTDENSEWHGSWSNVPPYLTRLVKLSQTEGLESWGMPKTVGEMFTRIGERGLLPQELLPRLRNLVPAPQPKRVEAPSVIQTRVDALVKELREILPGSTVLYAADVTHEHENWLKALTKAFKVLKSRYPFPWMVASREMKKLVLDGKNRLGKGTEEAFWTHTRMVLRPKTGVGLGTLIHELGHAFQDMQPDSFEIDSWNAGYGNPPFSHTYFEDRAVEDFAECFRQFWMEPSVLKSKAPAKYVDMARRVA